MFAISCGNRRVYYALRTDMSAKLKLPLELRSRTFSQERARKTYEALLEAAEKVFVAKGFDATQTPDIAAEAGVSVGSFYRYFTDKREIFLEIMRRDLQTAHEQVMDKLRPEYLQGKGRRDTIKEILNITLANIIRHPGMQRVLLEMALRDKEVWQLKHAFDVESQNRIAELIGAICTKEQVADAKATAYVIHVAAVECAIRIAGERGALPVSRERAKAALTQLIDRAVFGQDVADE